VNSMYALYSEHDVERLYACIFQGGLFLQRRIMGYTVAARIPSRSTGLTWIVVLTITGTEQGLPLLIAKDIRIYDGARSGGHRRDWHACRRRNESGGARFTAIAILTGSIAQHWFPDLLTKDIGIQERT
jgi:hypothetical protein